MKDSYSSSVLISAMNLFIINGSAMANESFGTETSGQEQANLNSASLKSIESSWLEISPTCKARGFNASPTSLNLKEAAPTARSIYASFGA